MRYDDLSSRGGLLLAYSAPQDRFLRYPWRQLFTLSYVLRTLSAVLLLPDQCLSLESQLYPQSRHLLYDFRGVLQRGQLPRHLLPRQTPLPIPGLD